MDNPNSPQQEQQPSSSSPSSHNGSTAASLPPPPPPPTISSSSSSSSIEAAMTYALPSQSISDMSVSVIVAMTEFDIVNHPVKDTLLIVSSLLSLMIHKNDSKYNPQIDPITLFHSRAVPRISIESYLMRVLQFIPFTNEVLLNVLVYLDRIGGLGGMEMGPSGTVEGNSSNELVDREVVAPSISGVLSSSPSPRSSLQSDSVPFPATEQFKPSLNVTKEPSTSYSSQSPPQQPRSTSTSNPHSCSAASPVNHTSTCISSVSMSSSKNSKDPESCPIYHSDKSTRSNLNSESPMVHKRGRDDENLESNMAKSNLSDLPQHHHQEQTDSQPQNDDDMCRASKKTKLEPISSTSNIINAAAAAVAVAVAAVSVASSEHTQQQSTATEMTRTGAIDVQSMPGASTPAPTPKLAIASNGFRINSFNIHRLLITCIMVAAKFTSDHFYSNARYAKVGGLSLLELNQLELEFLFTTRFELNVKVEELQKVGNSLLRFKNRELASQQTRPQQQYRNTQPDLQRTSLHGNTIDTASVSSKDSQALQQKKGRFSIPSPTSPRNGPMSDRTTSTSSSLPSISSSLSSSPSSSSSSSSSAVTNTAATVSSSTTTTSFVNSFNTTTVIVVSGDRVQRPQLLSPPEEKHRWAESEVQVTEERIDQTQERNRSSSSQSSSG